MRYRSPWYRGLLAAILLCFIAPSAVLSAPLARPKRDYTAGAIVVKLRPSVDVRTFAESVGLRADPNAIERLGASAIYRLQIADGATPPGKAKKLNSDVRVLYAEPDYQAPLPEARLRSTWVVGGDSGAYLAQWAPAKMRLPEAHAITRGAGVTIAILDTGVDLSHPALAGHLVEGYDFVDLDTDPGEVGVYGADIAYGHGTHVAGLAALAAPEARIMPLRTLGPGGIGTTWTLARALYYAVEHGADVISLSFSFGEPSRLLGDVLAEVTCARPDVGDCRTSDRPGAVVVAAAGNSGESRREYPASEPLAGVIAVAATTDADTLASFSTYGSWVKVAAPGEDILSAIPGGAYATWSGTSMAAPLTAGAIALLRASAPAMRPAEAAARLKTTAARINAKVDRRVDAAATLGLGVERKPN